MTLLAIFAHPDDEVFSCGGTLARYADNGQDVYLICTTRGEEGEIVHPGIDAEQHPKGEARGRLREQELNNACQALGIHPPIFLNHHDSGFPIEVGQKNPRAFMNQDIFSIEAELREHIAQIKPDVMITFDPHGMYGHIDHITIHRAATAAFWSAGSLMQPAPRRLFYPIRTTAQVAAMKARMKSTTTDHLDPDIYGVSEDSLAAVIDIAAYAEQKRTGIIAHGSQFGDETAITAMLGNRSEMFEQEQFLLAGVRGLLHELPLTDLFAGLK
jgi:LmbE family N-acetylglucosaminyl deacetylase